MLVSERTVLSFALKSEGLRRRRVGGGEFGGEGDGKDVTGGGEAPERTDCKLSEGLQNSSIVVGGSSSKEAREEERA